MWGPLAYPLSWTLESHVGVRRETKLFHFGGRETEARRYQTHDLPLTWILQGAESEPCAPSASHHLCLGLFRFWELFSQNNAESWNNGTRDCLFLLLVASCYRRFQLSPALLGEIFSCAWGMHKGFDFPGTVLCLKSLLAQIKVLLSDLAETPWKAGWNTSWFSSSFSCQAQLGEN